jgi:hypothetical protein
MFACSSCRAQPRLRPVSSTHAVAVPHQQLRPVPRSHVQELVEVIGERYLEVCGMTEGAAPAISGRSGCTAFVLETLRVAS